MFAICSFIFKPFHEFKIKLNSFLPLIVTPSFASFEYSLNPGELYCLCVDFREIAFDCLIIKERCILDPFNEFDPRVICDVGFSQYRN